MYRTHLLIVTFLIAVSTSLLIVPSRAMGGTHYVAANGSDSNNGTSKTTPWLHAPGMPSCTGTCKAYTPAAGDQIIFRGGDTWHFGNSSLTPSTGGTWTWTWSGSSASFIYIGVDQTWFSGSSWSRPILTGDNPTSTSTSGVASCAYQTAGGNNRMVWFNGVRYFTFDNFEMTGLCAASASASNDYISNVGAVAGYNNPANETNIYIHGWTYISQANGGPGQAGPTGFQSSGNYGFTYQFVVIDGSSDSDYHALSPLGQVGDPYIFADSIIRYAGGTSVPTACHILHDVVFEYISNITDTSAHTDVFMCYGEANDANHPGDGTPNLFYNNVFRHIGAVDHAPLSSVFWEFPPGSPAPPDYVFNNIFSDYADGSSNYNNFCENGCWNGAQAILFNNTYEAAVPSGTGCIICNGSSSGGTITSVNNHWVTNSGTSPSAVFQSTANVTESTSLYQTITQAGKQGYSPGNDFAPTSSSGSTVTTSGTNEYNGLCSNMQSQGALASAVTACQQGATDGCSYNVSNHTLSCPGVPPVPRPPTGPWDIGAYQFSTQVSGQPAPPTNLTVVVQ